MPSAATLAVNGAWWRGKLDTPKNTRGTRLAALSNSVQDDLNEWHHTTPNNKNDDWIFPSENGKTPVWPTNVWHDKIRPTLDALNLSWVNYQVLRRSAATLQNELGVDGQAVASQLGHGLDVSQNVYNKVGLLRQRDAVNKLDDALKNNTKNKQKSTE